MTDTLQQPLKPNSLNTSSFKPSKLASAVSRALVFSSLATGCMATLAAPLSNPELAQQQNAAQANIQTIQFEINKGTLESALNQLGTQANILLSFPSDMTAGKNSQGLTGQYTVANALSILLKDSGLQAIKQQNGSYGLTTLDKMELDTVVIYGTQMSRYDYDEATSATGFANDVDYLPRSVQVLPEQLILDQNSSRLTDVLVNAASVTRSDGFGGAQDEVFIRGMDNNHLFIDGSPVSNRTRVDVVNVERVEVISGPASVLHGQVSPGGLINIITKKPQADSAHSVQMDMDDSGRQKLTLDSTGAINKKLQYRLLVSGEDAESYREVKTEDGTTKAETQSLTVSPSISYTPDENNQFTLSLGYSDKTVPIDRGTVAVDDGNGNISIADIPVERRLGSEYSERDSIEKRVQFDFKHRFDNGWQNKLAFSYFEKVFDDYQARPTFGLDDTPTNLLEIIGFRNTNAVQANGLLVRTADTNLNGEETDLFISNSLSGDFRFAGVDNRLYLGANYTERGHKQKNGYALQDITGALGPDPLYALDLNIIDIYSDTRPSYTRREQTVVNTIDDTYTEYGLSIQNLSYLSDQLSLLAGLRYDHFEIDSNATIYYTDGAFAGTYTPLDTPDTRKLDSSNDNISGQLGLLYQFNDGLSVYGSYSESFIPNYPEVTSGTVAPDEDLDPEEAEQYEVGIKSSLMNDKLRITAAAYELTRKNVWSVDNDFVSHLNGKERTKGIELSATMQFVPGLNVLASATQMDPEIVNDSKDTLDNEGNAPKSVPEEKARVWGSYELQQGNLAGLGFGLGAEYVGTREGDDANTFTLPSYTVFDVAAWYYIPVSTDSQLKLQAGIKNLSDEEYYTASINAFRINVGDPRTAYVTARLEF
jgi:iron complex outermembrane receptor protein